MKTDCYVDWRYVPMLGKVMWVAKLEREDGTGIEAYCESYEEAKEYAQQWESGLDKKQYREDYGGSKGD